MSDMAAKYTENAAASGAIPSEESCRCFSLSEIRTATNNFDDDSVIGIGGFGKVYKGSIDNGTITVAIKRKKDKSNQGATEFWTEVKMLSKLRHIHLVALIGYCNKRQEMILVYEYIAHGTLADHLYKKSREESGTSSPPLTWEQRLQICIGSARGLDYLHKGTHQTFIHRDVKTTNILLDEEWVAKISDFGLSKSTTSQSMTHVTTDVKGTLGYLDPDYYRTQQLTTKSDVYAFGVVLLEVLCGRPAVDEKLEEQRSLVLWAKHCIKKRKLHQIIDPLLIGQMSSQCLKLFGEVADHCLQERPEKRPTMAAVVESLENTLALHRKGKTEGIFTKMLKGMNQLWSGKGKYNNSKSERTLKLNDLKSSQVTVKGGFDPPKVDNEYKRTGKHALIVNQVPEKKAEEKGKEENPPKEEKKPEDDVGGDKEAKKGEATAKDGDAPGVAVAEGEEETTKVKEPENEFYSNNTQNYHIHASTHTWYPLAGHAPQMFSDENPNACSIL
ncbi:Receptor-like protein kinase [Actinidia chinensis var. chinensis]|uniref:Receptor-like protein kinase n=1 Tax=Actinidia chinensis var. chinensis TaxID=1590841 RepID=A0A2R6RXK0_ACTCC|nr:Receptor-like protein kinase [Actinidia chinensis var. chinensis]